MIHGLVRAADGRKMSKSLGNALDPLDVVETHGADALRLALIQAAAPGQDVPLQMEWVDAARRFGNKLWNATRFVMQHVEPGSVPADAGYPDDPGDESAWILSRLASLVADADRLLDEYRFSDAYGQVYAFAWSEAFDWYLELAKARLRGEGAAKARVTLGVVLRDLLKRSTVYRSSPRNCGNTWLARGWWPPVAGPPHQLSRHPPASRSSGRSSPGYADSAPSTALARATRSTWSSPTLTGSQRIGGGNSWSRSVV